MKLFISWSGEFSRKVAERLSIWIPTIIQTVDVFYSPDDIAKGENWGNRLSEELEQSNFGIVCLTPENVTAPWIHFEAGALSKAANSRVSPIMLGVTPSEVKGPLARLQNTAFDRDDFYRLFQSINNSSDTPLRSEVLKNAFDNSWQKLMDDIDPIIKAYASRTPTLKAEKDQRENHNIDSDAIQEILRLVRSLDNSRNAPILSPAPTPISEPNESPKNSDNDNVSLSCGPEDIDNVLFAVRKCLPSKTVTQIESFGHMLRKYGKCYIAVSENEKKDLVRVLHGIAPKAMIE